MTISDLEEYFRSHVDTTGFCWPWKGKAGRQYSPATLKSEMRRARLMSLELHGGAVWQDERAVPMCGNPFCVKPDHMMHGVEARFWSQVDFTAPNGCWEWTAGKVTGGYGRFGFGGKEDGAHRVAYRLTHGEIPTGMFVLHRCDNPPCCNPAHLFLGTQASNMTDMIQKGRARHPGGEEHSCSRLTAEQVREIRRRYAGGGITQRALAVEFAVSSTAVSNIVRGNRWRTLDHA